LTQGEKYDELLLKNHHKCPVDSVPLPKVQNVQKNNRNKKRFNGHDPKNKTDQRKHNRRQRRNSDKRNKENVKLKYDNKCHRCGDFSYFTKNYRTPKHLVALYQKSLKEVKPAGDKRYEAHTIQGEGCSK